MKYLLFLFFACSAFSEEFPNRGQHTGTMAPEPYHYRPDPPDFLEFLQKLLPPNPKIVDAGAFTGMESGMMAKLFPRGRIYAFEPIGQLYQQLAAHAKKFHNISTYPFALGERREERTIYLSTEGEDIGWEKGRISLSSSLYPPKDHLLYSGTLFEGTETVQVTTIDQWAEENGIRGIDMLWLDMQGYELPAMKASPNIMKTVSVILTEVEFVEAYEGQPLYKEVRDWLEEQGFVLVGGTFTIPKNPRQWFGDALFVRKELVHKL